MFVTSTVEVSAPSISYFFSSFRDYTENSAEFAVIESLVLDQFDVWFDPEFRLAIRGLNVYVRSGLFP